VGGGGAADFEGVVFALAGAGFGEAVRAGFSCGARSLCAWTWLFEWLSAGAADAVTGDWGGVGSLCVTCGSGGDAFPFLATALSLVEVIWSAGTRQL
jgi:hypothetical protein